MKKLYNYLFIIITSGLFFIGCAPRWKIKNPYGNVDWENNQQYKANLHTHTTRSDGAFSPQKVVDGYHRLGYKILALTDHNEVTYPWTSFSVLSPSQGAREKLEDGRLNANDLVYENSNPEELGMFAIQANEVSSPHHTGSFFNDYQQQPGDEDLVLEAIGNLNGLAILYHPGRYTARDSVKYNVDWYVDKFSRFDHLTGMEVYNQGDRYQNDRQLWDSILVRVMPDDPVWGYSDDDFHGGNAMGRNWNVFLLPELNEDWIRRGMIEGRFFYVYAFKGHDGPEIPTIQSVEVDNKKGTIEINATGQDSIRWISAGNVVSRGNSIQLSEVSVLADYVRAEIFGPESITGTQPFGIIRK